MPLVIISATIVEQFMANALEPLQVVDVLRDRLSSGEKWC